ncbi:MAG: hypothetical protein ACM3X9_02925 [Bacillota bacterium]
MGKFKLQPREFRLRAGARTDLDRNFLQIVNSLPDEANLSEFIKAAVVESYQRRNKLSEVEQLQQETEEMLEMFNNLCLKFRIVAAKNPAEAKLEELKTSLKKLADEIYGL